MTEVIDRLVVAMNAHDLDAAAGFFHEDYRSEQPAHPGRAFVGRAQMRANWEAMFAGVPDFHAEICRSVQDGATTWTEWRWSGTRSDGQAFEMRGGDAVRDHRRSDCRWTVVPGRGRAGCCRYRAGRGGPLRSPAATGAAVAAAVRPSQPPIEWLRARAHPPTMPQVVRLAGAGAECSGSPAAL